MKTRFLIKKTKAVLAANVITLLLANVGGVGLFLAPKMAQATPPPLTPTIWLTVGACGAESAVVDAIEVGQRIFINGKNFDAVTTYNWNVTGKPGNQSGDPGAVVASGSRATDSAGNVCFRAYKVTADDWGKYDANYSNKNVFYEVNNSLISGHVINDFDGDISPANGWNWEITARKGSLTKTATADYPNGVYIFSFTNFSGEESESGEWVISETLKPGWTQTAPVGNTYTVTVGQNTHVINQDFSNRFTAVIAACMDIDGIGGVNTVDLSIFADSYTKQVYNSKADFNKDGVVNDVDRAIFERAFNHPEWAATKCEALAKAAEDTKKDDKSLGKIETPPPPSPLLTLTVTNDATTFVAPGGLVNYVATVKNTGNDTAQNVKVVATLPNGIFFTDSLGVEKTLASGGTLAPNDVMTLKYQGTVKNDTINGVYKDTIKVTSSNNPELNGGTSVEVRVPVVEASKITTLGVTIQADVPFTNPGDTVKYTVNVTNTGVATAVDTRLKVTLPDGQTFAETGSTTREWTLGDIAVGAKNAVTFDGLVSATASAGIDKVSATATSVSISAAVTATMDLEVKLPQVLGAEITPETPALVTLPATGVGVIDYLILLSVGTIGLLLGARWWRLRHHMGYATVK